MFWSRNGWVGSGLYRILVVVWLLVASGPGMVGGSQPASVSDQDIMLAMEERLSHDQRVPEHLVDVMVRDGIVTVKGTVGNLLAKERIGQVAATLKGVRAVINRIHVVPPFPINDRQIKSQVQQALLENPTTELYDLQVGVRDGVVTLHGAVQSWQEEQLSLNVAKGIRGVRVVRDDMTIQPVENRSDRAIAQEVAQRLKYDVWVPHDTIDVHVDDGAVTLTGTVRSVKEKTRAAMLAWVYGVTAVKNEELQIDWENREPMQKADMTQISDQEIREAVRKAFSYDPRLSASTVTVEVKHGTLTLEGTVPHLEAKTAAEHIARDTVGVTRVVNVLKVRPTPPVTDAVIKTHVNAAFQRNPFLSEESLHVSVYGGRVYLEGKVRTTFQKSQAEALASRVSGVVDVINRIHHPIQWLWKSDWEIKQDIRHALQWSPRLPDATIRIKVEDGKVTLRGTVQTKQEALLAQHTALEVGARSVQNELDTLSLH